MEVLKDGKKIWKVLRMERRKERGFGGFEENLTYLLSLFPVEFTGCIKCSRSCLGVKEGKF